MSELLRIDLAAPLRPIDPRESELRLEVAHGPAVLGIVALRAPAMRRVEPAAQLAAVEAQLGERVREHLLRAALRAAVLRATDDDAGAAALATVVVVADGCDEDAAATLRALEGVRAAGSRIVIGGTCRGERDGATWIGAGELTDALGPDRAGWVAITRAGAEPEPAWLDGLAQEGEDTLLAAITGFTATTGETLLDLGPRRAFTPVELSHRGDVRTLAGRLATRDNLIIRREFAAGAVRDPATVLLAVLRDGFRVVYDPARCVRARRDAEAAPPARRSEWRPVPPPFVSPRASDAAAVGPFVSIVVPSFNRRAKLEALLDALGRQTAPLERFEVIVVLDGSTDGSAEALANRRPPFDLRVLQRPNAGVAASRNAGIRVARHDVIVNLDDDMEPAPGFVTAHAAAHLDGDDRAVAIGQVVTQPDGRADRWALVQRVEWEDHYRRKVQPGHTWSSFDFSVGNSSLHRGLLEDAGMFDESMRRHDDQELGTRLYASGAHLTLHADALAWHRPDARLATGLRQIRAQARYDVELARRHRRLASSLPFVAMAPDGRLSARASIAFRLAWLADALLATAPVLDRAFGRTAHGALLERLTAVSYVRGLRDAVRRPEVLQREVRALSDLPPAIHDVDLAAPGRLALDPRGGPVELRLLLDDARSASTEASEPIREWTWEALEDRLVNEAMEGSPPLERLVALTRRV